MAGIFQSVMSIYREQVERQNNRPFLEAVMSAAAIVCAADGEVTFSERVRLDQIIEALDKLQVFDPHEAVDLFNEYVKAIQQDPELAHEAAVQRIEPLTANPEVAALILRVCMGILEIEGKNNLTEQIAIVTLCSRLNIDPSDCGLYIDMPVDDFLRQDATET